MKERKSAKKSSKRKRATISQASSLEASPVVTMDGPAASGKSSVSRELARRLGWSWVSTGAFYRGLAYVAFKKATDLKNEDGLVRLAESTIWSVEMTAEKTCVFLDENDVTEEINREEIGNLASIVSQFPKVRKALLEAQRRCAIGVEGLVAEGRDCGSIVFPDAPLKVFLTARAGDRAARRAKDEGKSVSETKAQQAIRDTQDATRKAAPMQIAEDALVIDTSELSFLQVVEKIESQVRKLLSANRVHK